MSAVSQAHEGLERLNLEQLSNRTVYVISPAYWEMLFAHKIIQFKSLNNLAKFLR